MQSNKREITIQGKEYDSLESAAKAFGKSRNTVDYRLSKGWTPEEAVGLIPPPSFASKTPGIPVQVEGGMFKTLKDTAKHYERAYTYVIEMLKKGRSIEQMLGLVKRADTLARDYPELAKQWYPTKNNFLLPSNVSYGSGLRVWWQCSNNHEWKAVINSRRQGSGCPCCAGQRPTEERNFAATYPHLLKEWDFEKNIDIDPHKFTPRANKKIWWTCEKNHSWQATIYNPAKNNSGCPLCARNGRRKYSIEYFQNFANKRGGQCLSTEYLQCK